MRTDRREMLAVGIFGRSGLRDRIEMLVRRSRGSTPGISVVRASLGALLLLALTVAGALMPQWIVFAQRPDASNFEVASIKPNVTGDRGGTWRFAPGGRLTGENITAKFLLTTAFGIREVQLLDVPGWIDAAKYDIVAKGEGHPDQDQLMRMLKGLLVERFKLRYHEDTKELPIYTLMSAKGGVRLTESRDGSCTAGPVEQGGPDRGDASRPFCGMYFSRGGEIKGARIHMSQFAEALELRLNRPVIDGTGFRNAFDIRLQWTPDAPMPGGLDDEEDAALFSALPDQLGLRLKPGKDSVKVVVIDHVERPDDN